MTENKLLINGFRRCEKVLSNLALGAEQNYVFEQLHAITESNSAQRYSCIYLLDSKNHKLKAVTQTKALTDLVKAIEAEEIGQYVGASGSAAFLGQVVMIDDIASHPNWLSLRDLANTIGIKSCWSVPILSSKGRVFGAYTIYSQIQETPSDSEIEIHTLAAHIASVAIEKNNLEQELLFAATHDPLTRLPNRNSFENSVTHALNSAERRNLPFSLLYIDLNDFKLVNDLHGHEVGDKVLYRLAQMMKNELRGTDMIARLGGDQFLIGLSDTSAKGATRYIERLQYKLNDELRDILIEQSVVFAVGIAEAFNEYPSLNELIKSANKAMALHKQAMKLAER